MRLTTFVTIAILLFAGRGVPAAAATSRPAPERTTLQVFAAASLSDAFAEMGRLFERQRPGCVVRVNLAGSQQLAMQIEQGAKADVFASADDRWMDHLRERGLIAGEPARFARNRLVVIVPRTNPARIRGLRDLARGGVKLVLGADAVPAGRYARTALRNLARDPALGADFAANVLRNVVSEEENVKSVVGKVQLGEADAGVTYRSDVTPGVARLVRVIEIPDSANVLASYPVALVQGCEHAEAGRAFVHLLLSPQGQHVLAHAGFLPVAAAQP